LNAFGFDIEARALPWQEVPVHINEGDFELTVWSWGAGSPLASQHFRNPIQRWDSALAADLPGLSVPYDVTFNGEEYNLDQLITNINNGLDAEVHRERADLVAQIINDEMFFIPLNVILSAEPFNTEYIDGVPSADDPLLQNPTGTDHFIKWYILHGQLGPTAAAMQ
jgi:hypothetical protein